MNQATLNSRNQMFWNELCGSSMATVLGITDHSPESLRRFDEAYFGYYPYLEGYAPSESLAGKNILEIGLGYGTFGQLLATRAETYQGLDIAEQAAEMMNYRLELLGKQGDSCARVGSALDIPFDDEQFDYVFSIGCLHHTGDFPQCIREVYRVLAPGGRAVVMVYNRHSLRRMVLAARTSLKSLVRMDWGASRRKKAEEDLRRRYDASGQGDAAPHTDFISKDQIRQLFGKFDHTEIDVRNFDPVRIGLGFHIPRKMLLGHIDRAVGLDLYVVATK